MKYLMILTFIFYTGLIAMAQNIFVYTGTTFEISANETFHTNGLTLVPSSAFDLDGLSISKNTTLTFPATSGASAVSRSYLFSANSPSYSGTLQINYLDAELNGLTESTLETNNYNGSIWMQASSATNDVTNNFVLTNTISNTILREITLASSSSPLPVEWLDFTATKQKLDVLLQWSTAQEKNTLDFTVQHSTDGSIFTDIITQPAAGNSNTVRGYSFVHTSPVLGYNYYRILQRDFDGKSSHSEIRKVEFTSELAEYTLQVLGNPIQADKIYLSTSINQDISLYSATGYFYWKKILRAGSHNIDVIFLPKGTYFLKTKTTNYKLVKL